MIHDETLRVRTGLVFLYGAVAAVVRGDAPGARMMLEDLRDSSDDLTELLAAISVISLERLQAALTTGELAPDTRRVLAGALISRATAFNVSTARAVHGAAWRLDAVRCGDHQRAARDVANDAADSSASELVLGATALLAAIVALWATSSGLSPRRAAADLCIAASFADAA